MSVATGSIGEDQSTSAASLETSLSRSRYASPGRAGDVAVLMDIILKGAMGSMEAVARIGEHLGIPVICLAVCPVGTCND